jgi:fructan beta-fructosidase
LTRSAASPSKKPNSRSFEIHTAMKIDGAGEARWKLTAKDGTHSSIGCVSAKQGVFVDRTHSGLVAFNEHFPARTAAPLPGKPTSLSFDIVIDRNAVEVFVDNGRIAIAI